jgi:hypothetical protein
VKSWELLAVPPEAVTDMGPLEFVGMAGTTALIRVLDTTLKVAAVVLNRTPVTPVKFVPVIATLVPTVPEVGVKEVMVGGVAATAGEAGASTPRHRPMPRKRARNAVGLRGCHLNILVAIA